MDSVNLAARQQERIARAVLFTLLYATPALICLRSAVIGDIDIWWHLRAAAWMVEHQAFPHTDPFSRYGLAAHRPWEAYSWLFEMVLLKLFQRWGLVGIVGYSAGMVLGITVAVHRLIARLEDDITKGVLLTMAVMLCVSPMFTPRPWLFTVLLFAVEMNLLVTARRSGKIAGLLWLPGIFALWANVHIQFLNGLLVLGVAAVEATVERWRPLGLTRLRAGGVWGVLIACVLATMVNPYGWGIYRVAYALASQKGVMRYVTELQPVPFRDFHDFLLLFLALGAAATLAWSRRLLVFEIGLLAIAAVVSFRSQRDVWLMAIVAGMIVAEGVGRKQEPVGAPPRPVPVPMPFLMVAAMLVVLVGGRIFKVTPERLAASLAAQMPVKAVEAIRARAIRGALYNTYDWGGYLMWTLREPVSLDGRAALHGDARIERAMRTWFAEPDWAEDPEFVTAGVVVAPVKMPLAQVLRLDGRFALVYEDALAAVFVRRGLAQTQDSRQDRKRGFPAGIINSGAASGLPGPEGAADAVGAGGREDGLGGLGIEHDEAARSLARGGGGKAGIL